MLGDDAAPTGSSFNMTPSRRRRIDGVHVDIRSHYEGVMNVDCRAGKLHWLGALAMGATSVTAGVTSNAAAKHRMVADGIGP